MTTPSRRSFLMAASASTLLPLNARTLSAVGVQLYTVRSVLPKKPLETLKAIEAIGYREIEAVRGGIDAMWPSFKETSLKPVSIHIDTQFFTKEQDKLDPALEDAKQRGFEYAVCPYIAPADRGGVDMMKRLGNTLNKAGERCKAIGLTLCYHNHAFEFE